MAETATKIKQNLKVKEPSMFRVIYVNDEVTTMDFVIESLMVVFDYTTESATEVTMNIHKDGSAIVAVLPYEIAEQKGVEATQLARKSGFPLSIRLEADS